MKPNDDAGRWLEEAGEDIKAAGVMARSGHFNWACFLAQQSAEKAAKALLYSLGVEDPWGHSVADLLADAASYDEGLGELQKIGAFLDKFYIPTRYPNGLPGGLPSKAYSDADAGQAISWAKRIHQAVEENIDTRPSTHGIPPPCETP